MACNRLPLQVTKIDDIFDCLLQEEETLLNKSSLSSQERVATVVAVNSIMEVSVACRG